MDKLFTTVEQAEKIAKNKMSDILYHNISKVSEIYKATLDISFPKIENISKYVSQRHDLVHRNGKDKKGAELTINKEIIDTLLNSIIDFVDEIDKQLNYLKIAKPSKVNEDDFDFDSIPF